MLGDICRGSGNLGRTLRESDISPILPQTSTLPFAFCTCSETCLLVGARSPNRYTQRGVDIHTTHNDKASADALVTGINLTPGTQNSGQPLAQANCRWDSLHDPHDPVNRWGLWGPSGDPTSAKAREAGTRGFKIDDMGTRDHQATIGRNKTYSQRGL